MGLISLKKLVDTAEHLDVLVFETYCKRKNAKLTSIIQDGVLYGGINWATTSKPTSRCPLRKSVLNVFPVLLPLFSTVTHVFNRDPCIQLVINVTLLLQCNHCTPTQSLYSMQPLYSNAIIVLKRNRCTQCNRCTPTQSLSSNATPVLKRHHCTQCNPCTQTQPLYPNAITVLHPLYPCTPLYR